MEMAVLDPNWQVDIIGAQPMRQSVVAVVTGH